MRKLSRDPRPTARQAIQEHLEVLEAEDRELEELLRWEDDEDPYWGYFDRHRQPDSLIGNMGHALARSVGIQL